MAKKQSNTRTAGGTRKATTKAAAATRTRDARLPEPGTTLTRTYKGREIRVAVLADGFRYDGETFRSLTGVALKVTGYPAISGPLFFKLDATATPAKTTNV